MEYEKIEKSSSSSQEGMWEHTQAAHSATDKNIHPHQRITIVAYVGATSVYF